MMKIRFFLLLMVLALGVVLGAAEVKPVKYVFLFIGDGMSIPQRMMADEFLRKTGQPPLLINQLANQAITSTRAANSFITDSAASGTAIACGEKTNNGYIGVAPDGRKLQSVAEVARDNGRKVGIVTSVTLNHATPASFYGHDQSRGNYYILGLNLVNSNFDYFGGGGVQDFNKESAPGYKGDIYALAQKAGYQVSLNGADFAKLKPGCGKVISTGATADLPYAIDAAPGQLMLADFTKQAIELLDNDQGFFLMVEGGKIDWMCHANDAGTTLYEVIDFDKAVKVAADFAKLHPEDTLIVVTGDHETGGLTLGFAGTGYSSYIERLQNQKISRDVFNDRLNKLAKQTSPLTFDAVKPLIAENFGLRFTVDKDKDKDGMALTEAELASLQQAFDRQFPEGKVANPKNPALVNEVISIFNHKAGLAWTSGAHTALPVVTTAAGAGADTFGGMIDNTDIAKRLKPLVGKR